MPLWLWNRVFYESFTSKFYPLCGLLSLLHGIICFPLRCNNNLISSKTLQHYVSKLVFFHWDQFISIKVKGKNYFFKTLSQIQHALSSCASPGSLPWLLYNRNYCKQKDFLHVQPSYECREWACCQKSFHIFHTCTHYWNCGPYHSVFPLSPDFGADPTGLVRLEATWGITLYLRGPSCDQGRDHMKMMQWFLILRHCSLTSSGAAC